MNPEVSIIIPTWNRSERLVRAVKSILSQSYENFELLICDDGSEDDSYDEITKLNDKRIIWLAGTHSGKPSVPKNRGIKNARGKWLAFTDSDDIWLQDKLNKQIKLLESSGKLAASTNAWRIVKGKKTKSKWIYWNRDSIGFKDILHVNIIVSCSTIIHKDVVKRTEGFPEEDSLRVGEDYGLWLKTASLTDFAYLNECLVYYTDDKKSSIRSGYSDYGSLHQNVINHFIEWAERTNQPPEKIRIAKHWIINGLTNIPAISANISKKIFRNLISAI